MFFDFAINTGLLITAKISVQNAADAAAYAGAATQARQLNAISYLNYDMRRQYKKFLFRYVFVGSLGSPGFPQSTLPGAPPPNPDGTYNFLKQDYSNSTNGAPAHLLPIQVPVVCIPLTTGGQHNDNCMSINMPNTLDQVQKLFPGGGATAITKSLLNDLLAIQQTQSTICAGQSAMNLFVLINWLFRGDVTQASLNDLNNMLSSIKPADRQTAINTVQSLVSGLGLYPRNIITLMRIETLESFLNQRAEPAVTLDKVHSWEGATETADSHERTIQAFRSALANLNASVMDPNDLTLTELESDHQFQHDDIQVNFNAYVQINEAGTGSTSGSDTICNSGIVPFEAKSAPVGVRRLSSPNTYYAVKVKTKAKLLFLPIKDGLELEAVSGAQPFGSRIGQQQISSNDFVIDKSGKIPSVNNKPICDSSLGGGPCLSPNLVIGGNNSFYTTKFLQALRDKAIKNGVLNDSTIMQAQAHALLPNPAEVGHYNILPPAKSDMASEFIPYSTTQSDTIYRFYAPLFPGGENNAKERVAKLLDKMFKTTNVGTNSLGIDDQAMKSSLNQTIDAYITKLDAGTDTENAETTTFAAVELPMSPGSNIQLDSQPDFWLTQSKEVLSSWSRSGAPRFGYSVRFVTMQNLLSLGMPDADGDLEKVSH